MTEFKAGDRVEYQNGIEEDPANGTLGTVLDGSDPWTRVHVEWDSRFPLPSPGEYPQVRNLRPVKPQKAMPKVGDIVRVVLVGRVRSTYSEDDGAFDMGILEANTIVPAAEHVKSIEIITPAKPSVADLPTLSVVRTGPDAYVKVSENHWYATGRGTLYSDADLDAEDWTLLVEGKS